ncbi:protein mbtH [Streptomyces sulfonofaciens]|uniref:Protein mbtH n=1 Tax=Streptomyces sulfonofaciens TaxID=68272 RepID=A0A919GP19_9ACTN|nr:MbtH family protein [Streptomyces sulfonofaciens]GHH87451.1 protein mbtH [Streptomyces sulfonofaciens]
MATNPFDDDTATFCVVVNHENQHSLWPVHLDVPPGWRTVLASGSRSECLAYVEEHWPDIRPASVARAAG